MGGEGRGWGMRVGGGDEGRGWGMRVGDGRQR